jgi:septal ring-binding cell division protein DamX
MKKILLIASMTALFASSAFAQTPTPTPSATPSNTAPAKAAPISSPAGTPAVTKPAANAPVQKVSAAGGGDGKVWVNSASKVYHCEGTKYYGKTKKGEYMVEADAKAKGFHGDHGKACSK